MGGLGLWLVCDDDDDDSSSSSSAASICWKGPIFLWLGVSLFVISPFSVWAIAFGKGLTCQDKNIPETTPCDLEAGSYLHKCLCP